MINFSTFIIDADSDRVEICTVGAIMKFHPIDRL